MIEYVRVFSLDKRWPAGQACFTIRVICVMLRAPGDVTNASKHLRDAANFSVSNRAGVKLSAIAATSARFTFAAAC